MWPFSKTKTSSLERKIDIMVSTLAQLDDSLAVLSSQIQAHTAAADKVSSDITLLLDALSKSPAAADFQTEVDKVTQSVAALQNSTSSLQTADASAQATLTPAAPTATGN